MLKRKIITIIGGGKVPLHDIGVQWREQIKKLWTIYDEDKMWASNSFNPYTGEKIVKGEQNSLEGLILLHEQGVLIEDLVHDWSVKSDGCLHYYSRYVPRDRITKILIEYEGEEK